MSRLFFLLPGIAGRVVPSSFDNFFASMTETPQQASDAPYFEGVLQADEAVLLDIFRKFRPEIIHRVSELGGSEAAGAAFFQTALVDLYRQMKASGIDESTPFSEQVTRLALAQFNDWLVERGQEPAAGPAGEAPTEAPGPQPDPDSLRATRNDIMAWRREAPTGEALGNDYRLWKFMRNLENSRSSGEPLQGGKRGANRAAAILFVVMGLLTIGFIINRIQNRSQKPAELFENHCKPPLSIMDDLAKRPPMQVATETDTAVLLERPNRCDELLQAADIFYKEKRYAEAAEVLEELLNDPELEVCHSDGYYYLGIIGLQLEKPGVTLQSFSKISDLERFGEDLYWFQALAFVQLAAKNPVLREQALGALERARSNTQDSLRRVEAEKMIQELQ